ncbi:MAG: transposase, partial [Pseudomonadota bacterium]
MTGEREQPEEIVSKLRQVKVLQGRGSTIAEAVRQFGMTQQIFYGWRKLDGGMQWSQLARMKKLEKENQRLRRVAFYLTLDKLILTEVATGNFVRPLSSDQWWPTVSPLPAGAGSLNTHVALGVSQRRACRTLGQHRSTQHKVPQGEVDEQRLTDHIIELSDQYGRYG